MHSTTLPVLALGLASLLTPVLAQSSADVTLVGQGKMLITMSGDIFSNPPSDDLIDKGCLNAVGQWTVDENQCAIFTATFNKGLFSSAGYCNFITDSPTSPFSCNSSNTIGISFYGDSTYDNLFYGTNGEYLSSAELATKGNPQPLNEYGDSVSASSGQPLLFHMDGVSPG